MRRPVSFRSVALASLLLGSAGAEAAPDGAALFLQQCSGCHQATAEGAPGQFPPLKNRIDKIAATPDGQHYLAAVLTHGLGGPIQVGSDSYAGYMPAFPQLKDEEIAAILDWLSAQGGTKPAPEVPVAVVAKARAEDLSPPQVNAVRNSVPAAAKS